MFEFKKFKLGIYIFKYICISFLVSSLFKKGLHNKLFNEVDGDDYLLSDIAIFENGKGHENIVDDNGEYILINSKFISTEGNVIKNVLSN